MPVATTAHTTKSDIRDITKLITTILKEKILEIQPGRFYQSYKHMMLNPIWNTSKQKLKQWVGRKVCFLSDSTLYGSAI